MSHATLIVNPFASRVTEEGLRAVQEVIRPERTLFTERGGHATELARSANADIVVVYGGDGVANEVLNGLERDVPVGFLPGGGTSVLARALGLPRDPVAAARRVAAGRTRRISLGRVNGRRFGFSAGIGIDAEAVRRVDAHGRTATGRRPGDLAFALTLARILAERRGRYGPQLEVRGHGRAALAFVANARPYTYAGPFAFPIVPRADFDTGLDLLALREVRPSALPLLVPAALLGRAKGIAVHDADRIEIVCDRPLPLQADGEDLGDVEDAVFEAEREAVSVLV